MLIHGWPLSADSWDPVALALAESGFRAIAYDRRGFGRSDQPWRGYDYDTFADDLAEVMAANGAREDVALVGFSMGGGEVARYLSRHGGRGVSRVALVSSVVPYMLQTDDNPDGVPQEMFDEMTAQMRADRAAFFRTFFKQFFGVGLVTHPVSDEQLDLAWATAMQAGLHPTLAAAAAFATTDFRPDLAAFTMPTLVVHGTADIHLVCAGTDGQVTEEDLLAAGAILDAASHLPGASGDTLDRSATAALETFRGMLSAAADAGAATAIAAAFATSRGGRNLIELGMQADLHAAAAIDSLAIVPRLDRGARGDEAATGWLHADAADPA